MADWNIVRYDPNYIEPLDAEIIPLCDALNDAGFVTVSSCSGHGVNWAHVWFEHSSDERIESLARFVKSKEQGDYRDYFSMWQKEILLDGYMWSVEIQCNNMYGNTPRAEGLKIMISAINQVAAAIRNWNEIGNT
jgi:hypothetical protein